jgi:hypothetical protein
MPETSGFLDQTTPEPTFPTDIRARTRSDIGRSADGEAETTSVTSDSRKLDEGKTVVLVIWLDRATIRFRVYQPSSFNTALRLVLRPHFLVHFV